MKDQKNLLQLQEENESLRLRLSGTERELAIKSKALEESEKKASHFIKFAPTAIYEIDFRSKKIVTANDAMVSLSGYSREELLSMKAIDILDKESILAFQSRLEKMAKGEIPPDQVEYQVKRKDGSTIYALLNVKFNLDDHGVPVGAVVVGHDITERKQAEEKASRERAQLDSVFEAVEDGICVFDMAGNLVLANETYARILGFPDAAAMRKDLSYFAPYFEIRELDGRIKPMEDWAASRVLRGERFTNRELAVRRTDTGQSWILSDSAAPVYDSQGRQILGVITARDITERKQLEKSLNEKSKEQQMILDTVPAMIFYKNKENGFIRTNKTFEDSMGLSKDKIEGKSAFDIYPKEQAEAFWKDDLEVIESGKAKTDIVEPMETSQGTRFLRTYKIPYFDDQGNVNGVIGFALDITERKEAEENVERFKALMDNNPSLVFLKDESGRYVYLNKAYERQFALSKDWYGKTDSDFWPKESADLFRINDLEVMRSGQMKQYFEDSTDKKGTRYCWLVYKFPFIDSNNKKYLGGIGINVTERVRAEEALAATHTQIQDIIDNATSLIYAFDLEERFILANAALAKVLNTTPGQLNGKRRHEFMPKADADWHEANDRQAIKAGKALEFEEASELPGRSITWLTTKFPLRDAQGKIYAVAGISADITERKQAEEALERERKQLLAIIESLDDAVGVWNTDGSLALINYATAKLYGFEMKEQMLKHLSDYADVQVRTMDGCELPQEEWPPSRVLRGETFSNWELEQFIPSINKRFIGSNSGRPVRDANGKVVLGVTSVRDITERKRAEEALRESEERLRHIAKTGRIGFVEYNIAKDTGYWSREHHEIFGYEPGFQISHEQWLQGVHPVDKDRVMANYARLLDRVRSEGHVEGHKDEYRFIRPDGDTVWIDSDMSADIVRDEPIISGSVRDITKRKQAEVALDESREKLNMALENANVGLWEWNLKTNEFILDEKIEGMFGLTPGIFGNTYSDFEKLIHEEDVPHFQKVIKRSIDNHSQLETIFRINPGNGKTKYYSARALLNTDNGRACGFTGVCFDITGMKESTDQLVLKLNEELLRSNKDLQQFAYVASHDLQEPLRKVTSFTQLLALRYGDKLDKEAHEFINIAVNGAKRMQILINDLLSYSRVQTKRKEFASHDMTVLLNMVIEDLGDVIKETRAIITYDKFPFISADEGQISHLLQNLIGNALKFNNNIPEIHIGFKEDDRNNVFSVKDNGIGIEEQYFERIFIIFQRLVGKYEYPGTGIGLSICKSIVERHGGRIWLESEFGKGTTFYFTIPKNFN